MRNVIFYATERDEVPVLEFLNSLDKQTKAKVERFLLLLQEQGEKLHRPYVDHLRGAIKELRIRRSADNIRVLFFFFRQSHIVLLHAFRKKSWAVPEADIEKADHRREDFLIQVQRGELDL